ncbi:MAG: PilZ domain-containing protein [Croceibacterium sp.]
MAVLTIRAHKRYAVRQFVTLRKAGEEPAKGLLIELSSEGCRISNVKRGMFEAGDGVTLKFDELTLQGYIRWAHNEVVGLRLEHALYNGQLGEMIARGRCEDEIVRYGT